MKVAFVTGGFPDVDNKVKGIFNKKAAVDLSKYTDLTVLHYRMLKPGRKFVEKVNENGYRLIRVSVPQIPFFNTYTICINIYILQLFIKPYLKEFDVVHSVSGITAVSIGRLKKKFNFKHVCQMIGGDINFMLPGLKKIGCIKKLIGIDEIVCNSNSLGNQFDKVFGKEIGTSVIYRGVALDKYINLNKDLKEDMIFLFLGGLVDYSHSPYRNNLKGGITLMKAWGIIDKMISKNTSVKLLFAGPSTSANNDLIKWREKLNFKNKVEILGRIDPEDIITIYKKTNVTIIPSQIEGFPNVGMESFAAGNCVIGSDAGGLPELIDEGINGLIFKAGDEIQLAEKILELDDVKLINKLGKNARAKAVEKYDNAKFAEKYMEVYSR